MLQRLQIAAAKTDKTKPIKLYIMCIDKLEKVYDNKDNSMYL